MPVFIRNNSVLYKLEETCLDMLDGLDKVKSAYLCLMRGIRDSDPFKKKKVSAPRKKELQRRTMTYERLNK